MKPGGSWLLLALLFVQVPAWADQVAIQFVSLTRSGNDWQAEVTLRHNDTGWNDYADAWRIVDGSGRVLATRTLWHPHVDEQPFTRGLGGIHIPPGTTAVVVEAHDKVLGWSPDRVRVDLSRAKGERYRVVR
jgi:hypothetical protein